TCVHLVFTREKTTNAERRGTLDFDLRIALVRVFPAGSAHAEIPNTNRHVFRSAVLTHYTPEGECRLQIQLQGGGLQVTRRELPYHTHPARAPVVGPGDQCVLRCAQSVKFNRICGSD